jgi:glutathione S-transferase
MEAKLYVILGSHACRTGMLLLEHKGIEYRPVVLPTGLHPAILRLRGFSGNARSFRRLGGRDRTNAMLATADRIGTVPSLEVDGRHVKTNRAIARFLEELRPDPPLFPADPERRQAVEEAERWGDDVFQMAARRIALAGTLHGPDAMFNRGSDGRLGPLLWHSETMRYLGTRLLGRFIFRTNPRSEEDLLAELPGLLDTIDGWIEAGVLNGQELNAADYMIAPSLALLTYRRDLRPEIERRPAIRLVDRILPEPTPAPAAVPVA